MTKRIRHAAFALLVFLPSAHAHHEAIFGPQSSTLISRKRFVAAQYYSVNQGRNGHDRHGSHIGTMGVGIPMAEHWSLTATLPVEAEREHEGTEAGLQDLVFGIRYRPQLAPNQWMMAVLTLEPPTGNLEHRAFGTGGGLVYGTESGHWSAIAYGLGRTEFSFENADQRGNRVFLGGGVAYETEKLPFSPQLGLSWEHTGQRREDGILLPASKTSALMIHPTLSKTLRKESVQVFFVVSLPLAQRSGNEGWQRFRIGSGIVWQF